MDDDASRIIFLLGPPKLSPRFRTCVSRPCIRILPALSGPVVSGSIKVQSRPKVVARVSHREYCYDRSEEVSRESLLSSIRRKSWSYPRGGAHKSTPRKHRTRYITHCCRSNGCRETCAIFPLRKFELNVVCLSPA